MQEEIRADLHIHTRASDGVMDLAAVVDVAARAGLEAVAVTDHDRLHPDLDAPSCRLDGLEVIRGVEIRVELADSRVDLLGYGVHRTAVLDALLGSIQRARIQRGSRMIDSLETALDVQLDLTPTTGLGRPQIAAAVVAATETYTTERVFAELIGAGCPHYVRRWVPEVSEAIDALRDAGALVALAHPYRYPDLQAATTIVDQLDAIEVYYPYARQPAGDPDLTRIEQIAADAGLVVTGGSDAHGRELGVAGLDADGYRRFREALADAGRRTA
jgi:Predicted metal-dependent phosphoesterases (PHP family)